MMNKETLIIYPKKIILATESHGNAQKTLKHIAFLERLFAPLRVMAVPP